MLYAFTGAFGFGEENVSVCEIAVQLHMKQFFFLKKSGTWNQS